MVAELALLGLLVAGGITFHIRAKNKRKKQDENFKRFFQKLTNAKEPESIERADLQKAFDPEYWKEYTGSVSLISDAKAKELAVQIYEAWNAGTLWDDLEEEVYEAFQSRFLKSYADVSKVAEAYDTVAGRDLWDHLEDKLSDQEMAEVKRIVSLKNN